MMGLIEPSQSAATDLISALPFPSTWGRPSQQRSRQLFGSTPIVLISSSRESVHIDVGNAQMHGKFPAALCRLHSLLTRQ